MSAQGSSLSVLQPPAAGHEDPNARIDHAQNASRFLADKERAAWFNQSIWFVRQKRDRARDGAPDWEALRAAAEQIKSHTLSRLAPYLEEFERNAAAAGATVHWAADAEEHNRIVHGLLEARGVKRLVKSKSMLTEECHLNPYLEARGIEVVDTDLGERIVQFRNEPPSHIVMPALHLKKEEIGALFHEKLGTPEGLSDPTRLTEAARGHLRDKFLAAQAGLTGVNFALASTGGFVVCTNEGNADLGTALPPIHIACMGVEKVIPGPEQLPVFLRLLARSATGQSITSYTSHFHGPRPGGELHIVIVDGIRSKVLARPEYRAALRCIRCAACMNTCPVYRRSGGHSYGTTVPGPIGAVLAPHADPVRNATLPFASTLCGSCSDVCPVRIDLHTQLLTWRGELARLGLVPLGKRLVASAGALVLGRPWLFRLAGRLAALALKLLPRSLANSLSAWGIGRELPQFADESFQSQWRRRQAQKAAGRGK
jgi:L-lactate dehydrogenase complex protein LldF